MEQEMLTKLLAIAVETNRNVAILKDEIQGLKRNIERVKNDQICIKMEQSIIEETIRLIDLKMKTEMYNATPEDAIMSRVMQKLNLNTTLDA